MVSVTAYKAGDLAIEHNVDIHPALFPVELLPTQSLEAFQFHSVKSRMLRVSLKASFQTKHLATTRYLQVWEGCETLHNMKTCILLKTMPKLFKWREKF